MRRAGSRSACRIAGSYRLGFPHARLRSLVLLGILAFAFANAGRKILVYVQGGEVPELIFGPILIYTVVMVLTCLGLAAWHGHNWRKDGKKSELLRTERSAALVDGAMSAGAGGALLGVTFLRGTPLEVIVPIADALVIAILVLFMVGQPIRMLRGAVGEVLGAAAPGAERRTIRDAMAARLADRPFELLEVAVTKLGRYHFVVADVRPTEPADVEALDGLREELQAESEKTLGLVRSEIVFTARHPYSDARVV